MRDCCEKTKASKIKVSENGKHATFINKEKALYHRIKVDGCMFNNETACDWLVTRHPTESVVIELKGVNVDHALNQIEVSFEKLQAAGKLTGKLGALIVCSKTSRHPSFTSKLQKMKEKLAKSYQAPLHIVTSNREYEISRVVSHNGPF